MHAVVARSACRSQHVQNTPCSDHFLEVELSKKCTPLWREAHFEVKMLKARGVRDHFWKLRCRKSAPRCGAKHISKSKVQKTDGYGALLDVQMSFRVAGAKGLCTLSRVSKTRGVFVEFATTTTTTPHYTPIQYTPLHYTTLNYIQ